MYHKDIIMPIKVCSIQYSVQFLFIRLAVHRSKRTRRPLQSSPCRRRRSGTWTSPTMPARCSQTLPTNLKRAPSRRMREGKYGIYIECLFEKSYFHSQISCFNFVFIGSLYIFLDRLTDDWLVRQTHNRSCWDARSNLKRPHV